MLDRMNELAQVAHDALAAATAGEELKAWHAKYLSKSSELQQMSKGLGQLSKEERPVVGKRVNEIKRSLKEAFDAREEEIREAELDEILGSIADVVNINNAPRSS